MRNHPTFEEIWNGLHDSFRELVEANREANLARARQMTASEVESAKLAHFNVMLAEENRILQANLDECERELKERK